MATKIINIDDRLDQADWPKTTWDELPKFDSPEFLVGLDFQGLTLEQFKKLPVYKFAVAAGKIKKHGSKSDPNYSRYHGASAPTLTSHLEQTSEILGGGPGTKDFKFKNIDEFVLKNGQAFHAKELPEEFEAGTPKQCYRNAALLAIQSPDLTYVEGYALSFGIPMGHAWVVNEKNNVIDNTWTGPIGSGIEDREYFGVKFSDQFLTKTLFEREKYGVLFNPEMGFPILRNGVGKDDIVKHGSKGDPNYSRYHPGNGNFEVKWGSTQNPHPNQRIVTNQAEKMVKHLSSNKLAVTWEGDIDVNPFQQGPGIYQIKEKRIVLSSQVMNMFGEPTDSQKYKDAQKTLMHEIMHSVNKTTNSNYRDPIGRAFEEGLTEHFTRQQMGSYLNITEPTISAAQLAKTKTRGSYGTWVAVIRKMEGAGIDINKLKFSTAPGKRKVEVFEQLSNKMAEKFGEGNVRGRVSRALLRFGTANTFPMVEPMLDLLGELQ